MEPEQTLCEISELRNVLVMHDAPLPEPTEGKVRVWTTLAAIHNHDLWTVRSTNNYRPRLRCPPSAAPRALHS